MSAELVERGHKAGCKCGFCLNKGRFGKVKAVEKPADTPKVESRPSRIVASLLEDDIPGGKAPDTHEWTDIDPEQLAIGTKVEMEHTDDPHVAEEIAADHLTENPDYYRKLRKAGLADEL